MISVPEGASGAADVMMGIVLAAVGARVGVQRVVGGDAVARQIDADRAVGVDRVAPDGVAGDAAEQDDAADGAVRDDVGLAGGRAADRRVVAEDRDAAVVIAQREGAGGVGSDEVALNDDAGDAARDRNAVDASWPR